MKPLASARGLLWDSLGLFSASLLPFELKFEVLWMVLRLFGLFLRIAGSVRRALGDKSVHMLWIFMENGASDPAKVL